MRGQTPEASQVGDASGIGDVIRAGPGRAQAQVFSLINEVESELAAFGAGNDVVNSHLSRRSAFPSEACDRQARRRQFSRQTASIRIVKVDNPVRQGEADIREQAFFGLII